MELITWVVYGLSFFTFAGSLILFLFLYSVSGADMIRKYLYYAGFGFIQLTLSAAQWIYFTRVSSASLAQDMVWFRYLQLLISAGFTVTAPAFFFSFAQLDYSRRLRRIFTALAVGVLTLSPLIFIPLKTSIVPYIPDITALVIFLIAIIYSQIRIIKVYPRMEERLFRVGIPAIVLFNIANIVLGAVDSTVSQLQIQQGAYGSGILFIPVIYIFWNSISFIWVLRFYRLFLKTVSPEFDAGHLSKCPWDFTGREIELISLMSSGLTNKEIGDRLHISVHTVRNHLHNIFQKTGSGSRVELLRKLM